VQHATHRNLRLFDDAAHLLRQRELRGRRVQLRVGRHDLRARVQRRGVRRGSVRGGGLRVAAPLDLRRPADATNVRSERKLLWRQLLVHSDRLAVPLEFPVRRRELSAYRRSERRGRRFARLRAAGRRHGALLGAKRLRAGG
jgi:hypothetical protein